MISALFKVDMDNHGNNPWAHGMESFTSSLTGTQYRQDPYAVQHAQDPYIVQHGQEPYCWDLIKRGSARPPAHENGRIWTMFIAQWAGPTRPGYFEGPGLGNSIKPDGL